jgi:hypothetical protein
MKLPAFQFYPGDWRKDTGVQSLDYQSRGVWFEILCLMHESENRGILTLNSKAMPESALARLLGLDEILLKQIITTLLNHGVASRDELTGAIMCRRMIRDEKLRKVRAEAGKQGGNPALLKQKQTTKDNQISTPSSSSSLSTSSSEVPIQKCAFQIKAEKLMNRRQSTPWSAAELRAWRAAKPILSTATDAEWELMEWWYSLPSSQAPYRKTDFAALLNNWHAEIEKARRNKDEAGRGLPEEFKKF